MISITPKWSTHTPKIMMINNPNPKEPHSVHYSSFLDFHWYLELLLGHIALTPILPGSDYLITRKNFSFSSSQQRASSFDIWVNGEYFVQREKASSLSSKMQFYHFAVLILPTPKVIIFWKQEEVTFWEAYVGQLWIFWQKRCPVVIQSASYLPHLSCRYQLYHFAKTHDTTSYIIYTGCRPNRLALLSEDPSK